jgi:hypothetical protein
MVLYSRWVTIDEEQQHHLLIGHGSAYEIIQDRLGFQNNSHESAGAKV